MTKNKEKNLKEELNDSSVNAETAQETVQEAQPESVDNAPDKDQLSEEEKLRLQVEELEGKLAKEKDDYIRLMAEFDNFRRRTSQEKLDLVSVASMDTIKGLLPEPGTVPRLHEGQYRTPCPQPQSSPVPYSEGNLTT